MRLCDSDKRLWLIAAYFYCIIQYNIVFMYILHILLYKMQNRLRSNESAFSSQLLILIICERVESFMVKMEEIMDNYLSPFLL